MHAARLLLPQDACALAAAPKSLADQLLHFISQLRSGCGPADLQPNSRFLPPSGLRPGDFRMRLAYAPKRRSQSDAQRQVLKLKELNSRRQRSRRTQCIVCADPHRR